MSLHVSKIYGERFIRIGWYLHHETRADDVALRADILAMVQSQYPKDYAAFKKAVDQNPNIWDWPQTAGGYRSPPLKG